MFSLLALASFISVRWKTRTGYATPETYPQRIGPLIMISRKRRPISTLGGLVAGAGAILIAVGAVEVGGVVAFVGICALGAVLWAHTVVRTFEHYSGRTLAASQAVLTVPFPAHASWAVVGLVGGLLGTAILASLYLASPDVRELSWYGFLLAIPTAQAFLSLYLLVARRKSTGNS